MVSSGYDNCQRLPLCLYPLGIVRKKKIRENNSRKLMPNKNISWKKKKKVQDLSAEMSTKNENRK